tara:strand:+ start:616 stop:765 length:150 start_codon:yes stop_codon:yes gene_type:complete
LILDAAAAIVVAAFSSVGQIVAEEWVVAFAVETDEVFVAAVVWEEGGRG